MEYLLILLNNMCKVHAVLTIAWSGFVEWTP